MTFLYELGLDIMKIYLYTENEVRRSRRSKVRAQTDGQTHTHTQTQTQADRQTERQRDREREREGGKGSQITNQRDKLDTQKEVFKEE